MQAVVAPTYTHSYYLGHNRQLEIWTLRYPLPPTQYPPNENKQIKNYNLNNLLNLINFLFSFFFFFFFVYFNRFASHYLSHPSNVWPSMVNLHKQGGWLAHQASYRSGWTASFDYIGSSTDLVNSWRWPNQSLTSVEWV
jgi:hypothetical protein